MSMLTDPQLNSLLEIITVAGNCGKNTNVNMTPSLPREVGGQSKEVKEIYDREVKEASAVCVGCLAIEACYVYSIDQEVSPVFAAGLDRSSTMRLKKIMRNPSVLNQFVLDQVDALIQQKDPPVADRSVT